MFPTQSFAIAMRDRAVDVLTQFLDAAGVAVFKARSWPVKPDGLPVMLAYFHTEIQTSKGMGAPPEFDSKPELIFELRARGDDSAALEYHLDFLRVMLIETLMTSPAFLAAPLEKVTAIHSVILEREQENQFATAQVKFTLQTTEFYEPIPFPDLSLIDAKIVDAKGRVIAEAKIAED